MDWDSSERTKQKDEAQGTHDREHLRVFKKMRRERRCNLEKKKNDDSKGLDEKKSGVLRFFNMVFALDESHIDAEGLEKAEAIDRDKGHGEKTEGRGFEDPGQNGKGN